MAIGALVVPGLVAPGPMQSTAGFELLLGIEVEPMLAALLSRPAIPGDAERLITPAGKCDQVLLQRIDAECIGDLIIVQRAIGTVGEHNEPVAVAEKGGRDPEMLELRAGKVAEHSRVRGAEHGERVVRVFPGTDFRAVCRQSWAAHRRLRHLAVPSAAVGSPRSGSEWRRERRYYSSLSRNAYRPRACLGVGSRSQAPERVRRAKCR